MANKNDLMQSSGKYRSEFARRLEANKQLAARCEKVARAVRDAADKDIQNGERSERLTKDDFAIYINARADITVVNE